MRFAEVVDSLKNAKEFMELNHIEPSEIIVVWNEDIETHKTIPDKHKELKERVKKTNKQLMEIMA